MSCYNEYLFLCRSAAAAAPEQTEVQQISAPSSPQKPSGFRLFQSGNNSGANNNTSPAQNQNNAQQNQQPPTQPNGILKNSYDRDAMSRVGQR